jgi:hypothetical protein
MQNGRINRIDSRTIKRDQLGWLDVYIVPLGSYFACIAFRWVAFSKDKNILLKFLRKLSFLLWGGQSGPLGRTVRGLLRFIDYLRFLPKFFEKNPFRADSPRVFGGRSENILESNRKVRSSGGSGGQSAAYRRTVSGALADSPPGPTGDSDSRWLRIFTIGI